MTREELKEQIDELMRQNAVIRIVFPLMIFMNQKKTLETITNNLRERKDD